MLVYLGDSTQAFVADRYSQLTSKYRSQAVLCCGGGFRIIAENTDANEMKLIPKYLGVASG